MKKKPNTILVPNYYAEEEVNELCEIYDAAYIRHNSFVCTISDLPGYLGFACDISYGNKIYLIDIQLHIEDESENIIGGGYLISVSKYLNPLNNSKPCWKINKILYNGENRDYSFFLGHDKIHLCSTLNFPMNTINLEVINYFIPQLSWNIEQFKRWKLDMHTYAFPSNVSIYIDPSLQNDFMEEFGNELREQLRRGDSTCHVYLLTRRGEIDSIFYAPQDYSYLDN